MRAVLLAVSLLVINSQAFAAAFKCIDAQGRVNFTDKPCPEASSSTVVLDQPDVVVADKEESFGPAIDQPAAGSACEAAAKSRASIPSSVDFSRFWSAGFQAQANGRATYVSTFTAKNAFGVDQEFDIACYFSGSQLVSVSVNPSR